MPLHPFTLTAGVLLAASLAACGGDGDSLPQLTAAQSGTLASCTTLASGFSFASTAITAATVSAAGALTNAGQPVGEGDGGGGLSDTAFLVGKGNGLHLGKMSSLK